MFIMFDKCTNNEIPILIKVRVQDAVEVAVADDREKRGLCLSLDWSRGQRSSCSPQSDVALSSKHLLKQTFILG